MKVYLATSGSYSSYRVHGVYARREDAEAYEFSDNVDERELLESPQEVRSWHRLFWYPDNPEGEYEREGYFMGPYTTRNPDEMMPDRRDYDGCWDRVEHRWKGGYGDRGSGVLEVQGWDIERVRKVFGELRAEWLNCKALGMVWDPAKAEWTPGEVDA